ncbi:hypothetical protein K4X45_21075 [Enterobacter roggenkampii]|nr:hypothetical protein [Enterobacter roggenkampii]
MRQARHSGDFAQILKTCSNHLFKLAEIDMYQEVLDALNEEKTTRQHMNKMEDFYNRATDPDLKKLIGAVGNEYAHWLDSFKKLAHQKTTNPVSKQRNVAKANAARKTKFIPSRPMEDGTVPLSVSVLIAYCKSKI